MTTWDKIYKKYNQEGEVWATLSEKIHPLFKTFLNTSVFQFKHVLDVGCGTGKYLKYLQTKGFQTDGIDSSETAIKMTKEILGGDSIILCKNMFEFEIPENKYDLIISVSTIHHGTKKQVQNLINKIYNSLKTDGKIFITLPDFEEGKKNNVWKNDKEIERGTYVPTSGPEKDLPHSFYTGEEIKKLFSNFKNLQLDLDKIGRWVVRAFK